MKKLFTTLFVLVLAIALAILTAIPANADGPANLVKNGGFESPTVSDLAKWQLYETSQLASTWTVEWYQPSTSAGTPVLEIQNGVCGPAYELDQFAELDSNYPTSISQNLNTVAGQNYMLTFEFSPRSGTVPEDNRLQVQWGDNIVAEITADGSATGLSDAVTTWTLHSIQVQATGSVTSLRFTNTGNNPLNSYGCFLDDVKVTEYTPGAPTPEMPAGILLGIGLFAVGGFVLVKRRLNSSSAR